MTVYAATKAAVSQMARSFSANLLSRNIRVNAVSPGVIDTDMTEAMDDEMIDGLKDQIPMQRLGQPEDIAKAGITINNVAPGAIATPINQDLLDDPEQSQKVIKNIPLRRFGEPEDVSGIVAFLASDEAKYITGSTFYVDGGLLWNYQEQ